MKYIATNGEALQVLEAHLACARIPRSNFWVILPGEVKIKGGKGLSVFKDPFKYHTI